MFIQQLKLFETVEAYPKARTQGVSHISIKQFFITWKDTEIRENISTDAQ